MNVQPITLLGQTFRLEPLSLAHAPGFAKNCERGLFQFFGGAILDEQTLEAAIAYVNIRLGTPTLSFAMILQSTGEAIGHSSFMNIRPNDRVLEIGSTWIGKEFQGTRVNPEAKLLMIGHAFE